MTTAPQRLTLRTSWSTYAGLFMVTLTTLMYEIVLTRIFSVTMWYHFAFVAISLALFGMTVGTLIVHLLPHRFRDEDVKRHLSRFSLLLAVSIPIAFVTQLSIPFVPRVATLVGLWSVVLTCIVISVPFVFSGIVVCLSLTRFPDRVNRLYAADLVGAAGGCVLLVLLLDRVDGPSAVVFIGAIAASASLLFALDSRSPRAAWAGGVALTLITSLAIGNAVLHSQGRPYLRILWAKEAEDPEHEYEIWNAFSRVTVDPVGFGRALAPGVETTEKTMLIDSTAGTMLTQWDGDLDQTDYLRDDVMNLAHHIRGDHGDVAVIGVGGGRDILSALEFGADSVTGIEINGNVLGVTNGRYGDFTGHLDRNPKVTFVEDDGRSYLTRTDDHFDIIQISLIDTWAATGAGAFALSENSLYTTDAYETYFDKLKPGGVLSVSRWYQLEGSSKPLEIYRTVALAAQSLVDRGVEDPRSHILVYKGPPTPVGAIAVTALTSRDSFSAIAATTLTSRDPFSAQDIATLDAEAERLGFTRVLTPDYAESSTFEALTAPGGPGPEVERFREDISPPDDDRPFFFQMADLDTVFSRDIFGKTLVTRPVLVLALLAIAVLGLAALCIMVPLLVTTERTRHRGMAPFYVYFAGIGLAFLLVEIAQLQRLSLYLGHPTYALTVVLFSVLLFSGIGSMLTERFVRTDRPLTLITPLVVLLGVVTVMGIATPEIIRTTNGNTTPGRIAIAIGMLMPLGLAMGMPFAIGMRAANARPGSPTAFFWGINGAMSVCASVFGVVIALFFGISTSYWVGAVAYAVTLLSMVVITRRPVPASAPGDAAKAADDSIASDAVLA